MMNDNVTAREKNYEVVYDSYANDVYKICFYYLRDENQAANITQQVFLNFYKVYDEVNPDHILGHLVREAKRLLASSQNHQITGEEVTECATNGKI